MLKIIRIIVAIVFFVMINALLLDYQGVLPQALSLFAKIQLVPSVLRLSIVAIIILLLLALFFGRIYCSCICPLGILQDINIFISRKSKLIRKFQYRKPQNILRYVVLGLIVLTLLFNVNYILMFIEPYSAYGRIANNLFVPVIQWINNLLSNVFSANFLYIQDLYFETTTLIISVITLFVIIFLSILYGRLYCNTVCPVGTFLGLISKFSFFKIKIDKEKCIGCSACEKICKSSCINNENKRGYIDYSRCVVCFDCVSACKFDALKYEFVNPLIKNKSYIENNSLYKKDNNEIKDSGRREFIKTATVATIFLAGTAISAKSNPIGRVLAKSLDNSKTPILPPGAINFKRFINRCTSCNLCISHCPTHVLRPALNEYGIDGFLRPTLIYKNGYCDYNCVKCSNICPSEAIKPLTISDKRNVQIGEARYYLDKCIVYTIGARCGACARHCPTGAISMTPYNDMRIPSIDSKKCIGCGVCEFYCPTKGEAIKVYGFSTHKAVIINNIQD